ncbi:MAG: nucleotidyl transferase AbiEii/AbiGii toxin family protein [Bacilli bacterium]|nr:nucleotidyl transferase AbiEii/AbiGii toxin family protein [Bacilli bacterium]
MNKDSLHFLYTRIKKQSLTKEEAERKVCQEVFIAKIGSDKELLQRASFKGGLILDKLAKGKRGYTKDIDFDFVKYPLSDEGLQDFFARLSPLPPYENITIGVDSIEDLRHKNYFGKRVTLSFSDGNETFALIVDVGVHLPLLKGNKPLDYEIAFGGSTHLSVNPVERMIAEKLSTFSIYGTDNTRDKDLFDAYWLITRVKHDKALTYKMLESLLVRRTHFFKTLDDARREAIETLRDKEYIESLQRSRRNWSGDSTEKVLETVIEYLGG